MEENQYDTIYHEHFSYFSLITVEKIFAAHGLVLFDVDEIPTHGGSIRIYLRHIEDSSKPVAPAVVNLRERELAAGLDRMETYATFAEQVMESKRALLELLIRLRREGKRRCGIRRARQREHSPELLWHSHGLPGIHRGSEPI